MSIEPENVNAYNRTRPEVDQFRFCHAPFNNIYFGNRGYVMACCFNKLHVIGRYPQQSIAEIWNGEKANELRKAITFGDFSKGCTGCQALFEHQNFGGIPASVYDRHSHTHSFPKRMEFELDNTCNLECVMCTGELSSAIRERRERKPPILSPYDDAFIQQLEQYIPFLETAQFLGGEPFLIPVYFGIWEKISALNPSVKISIQTNGTILNSRVKRLLDELQVSISISIDSLKRDTYKRIRVNGDLERVLENVAYFSDYVKRKQTSLSFSFCPLTENWTEIPDFVAFCNGQHASVFFNTVIYPAEFSLMNANNEQLNEIIVFLQSVSLPQGNAIEQQNYSRYQSLINEIKSYAQKSSAISEHSRGNLSLEEYLDKMREHIRNTSTENELTQQDQLRTVSANIHSILAFAEKDGLKDQAQIQITTINPDVLFQNLILMNDLERAYTLFKERILKVL